MQCRWQSLRASLVWTSRISGPELYLFVPTVLPKICVGRKVTFALYVCRLHLCAMLTCLRHRIISCPFNPCRSRLVVGAIDGSHFRIQAPPESLQMSYYNYKHFYSISLVAIVDNQGMFRWFCSGAPGACGDSGVFKDTAFFDMVEKDQSKPVAERGLLVHGACILGDSAFAESEWLRTPIGKPRTRAERFFNLKHSSCRFRVEHAFGRVKKKFRGVRKGLECRLENCKLMVNACVVLHNFIFVREGISPADEGVDESQTRNGTGAPASAGAGPAESARGREVAYLAQNFMVGEWGAPGSRADLQRQADERRMRGRAGH